MMIVPRYKELSVGHIWSFIREVDELSEYFPDLEEEQLPDRDFLVAIISTLSPDETKTLVAEARAQRSVQKDQDESNLVKIVPDIKEEIMSAMCF